MLALDVVYLSKVHLAHLVCQAITKSGSSTGFIIVMFRIFEVKWQRLSCLKKTTPLGVEAVSDRMAYGLKGKFYNISVISAYILYSACYVLTLSVVIILNSIPNFNF